MEKCRRSQRHRGYEIRAEKLKKKKKKERKEKMELVKRGEVEGNPCKLV